MIMLKPRILAFRFAFILIIFFSHIVLSSELYRYQDSNGNWAFGDRNSLGNNQALQKKAEKLSVVKKTPSKINPALELLGRTNNGTEFIQSWRLTNPLPAHVQHILRVKGEESFFASLIAEPLQEIVLDSSEFKDVYSTDEIEHFYLLGEKIESPGMQIIPLPYAQNRAFKVSQGFNGTYSHTGFGNIFAIDIAMPVGETVTAVRKGIVADARDDFSIGGPAQYFLDKANQVTVLHDDGSYAIYAHILYGSLAAKIGDQVEVGQSLARVGNTGFSTGPHLHFVIRYNSGSGVFSIPFKFKTRKGIQTPKEGVRYFFPVKD
jgi:murein DD-endopeptidase MepM/ murein hydrolase activator NlpD